MTFQPPPTGETPPPSEQPPQTSASPQWTPPSGANYPTGGGFQPQGSYPTGGGFDPKAVNSLDWGILAAGLLAFIFSMFDYYTVTVSGGGFSASASASAWHGFFGWFAALCALAGGVLVALELFAPQTRLPWPNRIVGLGLFAVATLCVIIALFVWPGSDVSGPGVDEGHGFGYWASLIVILAGLVLSLMRVQQTGGKLPGGLGNLPNIGGQPKR